MNWAAVDFGIHGDINPLWRLRDGCICLSLMKWWSKGTNFWYKINKFGDVRQSILIVVSNCAFESCYKSRSLKFS